MKKRKLAIISHWGSCSSSVLRLNSKMPQKTFTPRFIMRAKTFPNIRMVEDKNRAGSQVVYCTRKVTRKQTLQINATREKNNNFRMAQLGVKLHYFTHY